MSDLSITMIDSFNFNTHFPNVDIFREVVGKFARYLRVASLCSKACTAERFDAISDLEFPRLVEIEIEGWNDGISNFLARCSNLRRLKIRYRYSSIDLGQCIFPRVESVDFDSCTCDMIERVLGACPNVKHFSMADTVDESYHFIRWLNHFFADRASSMESISMDLHHLAWVPPLPRDGFKDLWHLRSMRVLKINLDGLTSDYMDTISNSFPNLQVLRLVTARLDDGRISTLSKLKNLIDLELYAVNVLCDADFSDFVMTSEAKGLRRLKILGTFSLRLVKNIIDRFPHLKNLSADELLHEDSTCLAVSNFAKHLRQFAQRDLKIVLFADNECVSESRRIRRAIGKIRRAAGSDERRPGLELDVRDVYYRESVQGFRNRIEKRIVRMYHRIFC